jgi:hypothetical protein
MNINVVLQLKNIPSFRVNRKVIIEKSTEKSYADFSIDWLNYR